MLLVLPVSLSTRSVGYKWSHPYRPCFNMTNSLHYNFHTSAWVYLCISCLWVRVTYSQFLVNTRIVYEFNCILMIYCRRKLIIHKWPQEFDIFCGGAKNVHVAPLKSLDKKFHMLSVFLSTCCVCYTWSHFTIQVSTWSIVHFIISMCKMRHILMNMLWKK